MFVWPQDGGSTAHPERGPSANPNESERVDDSGVVTTLVVAEACAAAPEPAPVVGEAAQAEHAAGAQAEAAGQQVTASTKRAVCCRLNVCCVVCAIVPVCCARAEQND
jgi:hypothetical protein